MDAPMKSRKIIDLIDLYADCQEKEAIRKAFPTELNRLAMVTATTRLERAIQRLAPHVDHQDDEFHSILEDGRALVNRIRDFVAKG